jgi:DNA polymerase III delta subunit
MSATYHIRIKKEYATAIIEDLQKKDALEFVAEEDAFEVPQWQKEEVRRRIEKYKNNPELLIDEDAFFAMLSED